MKQVGEKAQAESGRWGSVSCVVAAAYLVESLQCRDVL